MLCNFIDDLNSIQPYRIAKFCGVVLSVTKQNKFYSFIINDNTGSAQATIYEEESVYKLLQLPKLNDSVVVTGFGAKKQFKRGQGITNYILKIRVSTFKIITLQEQFKMLEQALKDKKEKLQKEKSETKVQSIRLKLSLIKQLKNTLDPLEMKSLVLCCLYITLQNNKDLNSYTFSVQIIKKHRLTKNFIESKKLREQSTDYLDQFIQVSLNFFVDKGLIDKKGELDGIQIYKIERKHFTDFQLQALSIINQKKNDEKGASLNEIVRKINQKLGFYDEKNYAFNEKFIQTILKKSLEENKILKTLDKLLKPTI